MPSTVKIQFLDVPVIGTWIELKKNLGVPANLREDFVLVRNSNFKVTAASTLTQSQINYVQAFLADYNSSGNFTAKLVGNDTVEVTHKNENFFVTGDVIQSTDNKFAITIVNAPDVLPLSFVSTTVTQSDVSACTQAKITVEMSELADEVTQPTQFAVTTNPFSFEWFKGQNFVLTVKKGTQTVSRSITMPKLLAASNIVVDQLVTPNGTKVTVNLNFDTGLTYSLDDVNFQTSNIFSGILPGNYTVYVKDEFGCKVSKDFEVLALENQIAVVEPKHLFSQSLSFHFAVSETIDDRNTFAWDFNTLSKDCFTHKVFKDEVFIIQFRSSYQNNAAFLRTDLGDLPLFIEKVATNIGLKDARDAQIFPISNNKSGIFFTVGNVYDFDTLQPTDVHALNGLLPSFAKVGNFVELSGNWFLIEEVIRDDEKDAFVIVINIKTESQQSVIVRSIWNNDDMDVFQITVPFANATLFNQIKVELRNPGFPDVDYYSQLIETINDADGLNTLVYSNSTNTDIMYSTGIVNNIRLPFYISNTYESDDEVEVNKSDDGVTEFAQSSYDLYTFLFSNLPLQIAIKLKYALMHDRKQINGRFVSLNGKPEIARVGNTENYDLTVKLYISDAVFNKQIGSTAIGGGAGGELVQLLDIGGGNFFKI